MNKYNDNETVTLSLERYENLKNENGQNQWSAATKDRELQACKEYLTKKGLCLFYKTFEHPIEIITLEESKKRQEIEEEKTKEFIKAVTGR